MDSLQNLLSQISVIGIIYLANLLFIIAVIFFERKTPTATLAWIMILAFVPVVGFVLYLILNQNIARYKINKLYEDETFVDELLDSQIRQISGENIEFRNPAATRWKDLIKLNQVYGRAYYTGFNHAELFTDGNDLRKEMIQDIRNARKSVKAEYFIIRNDEIGREFLSVLTEKAKEGVSVRLLVDAQGSWRINNRLLTEYLESGGKVGYFFQPELAKLGFKLGLKLNYRNHRKIVVIDDSVGYVGGYNIGDEYCDRSKRFGHWRDSHIRLTGRGVTALNVRFTLDWRFVTKERFEIDFSGTETEREPGTSGVQIVSCGPEAPHQEIKRAFMKMITSAKKSVYIQSPYFIPDPAMIESCKMAAQSGVDVRIMIPCKRDHIFVYGANSSYVGELLQNGCRIFYYENGFLHAKTIVVDNEVSSVGSCNFDIRSFKLNFETNAFIFDEEFAKKMTRTFEEDMKLSKELTLESYAARGYFSRLSENISRLFTEIL